MLASLGIRLVDNMTRFVLRVMACALFLATGGAFGANAGNLAGTSVSISFQHGTDGRIAVGFATDDENIAAAVISTPSEGQLIAIRVADVGDAALGVFGLIRAQTDVEIEGSSLAGLQPYSLLQGTLVGENSLTLTLVLHNGMTESYTIYGAVETFESLAISFDDSPGKVGGGGNCHTYTLNCSGGCSVSQRCCGTQVCVDCTNCQIICGQPCVILP